MFTTMGKRAGPFPYCRSCGSAYSSKQYRENPNVKKALIERMLLRQAFVDAEKAKGCIDCGERDFRVLDLDHVNGQKVMGIGQMMLSALPKLFAELDKCEVRCANCHRRITYERRRLGGVLHAQHPRNHGDAMGSGLPL